MSCNIIIIKIINIGSAVFGKGGRFKFCWLYRQLWKLHALSPLCTLGTYAILSTIELNRALIVKYQLKNQSCSSYSIHVLKLISIIFLLCV